jgi:hypothetical protein
MGRIGALNQPRFDGHFEKAYTSKLKGVSNEKETGRIPQLIIRGCK